MNQFKLFLLKPLVSVDVAFLLLRISACAMLFYKHGAEKIFDHQHMLAVFTDPHPMGDFDPIGIGKENSLWFATFTDGICSLFLFSGLWTRLASALILIDIMVSHFLVFKGSMDDHGELSLLYLTVFLIIFLIGPGKLSLDQYFFKEQSIR